MSPVRVPSILDQLSQEYLQASNSADQNPPLDQSLPPIRESRPVVNNAPAVSAPQVGTAFDSIISGDEILSEQKAHQDVVAR